MDLPAATFDSAPVSPEQTREFLFELHRLLQEENASLESEQLA